MAETEWFRIGRTLVPSSTRISRIDLRHIELDNVRASPAAEKWSRPELTDSVLTDLRLLSCHFDGCVLRDVEINGVESVRDPLFLTACDFTRVTLRGEVKGALVINSRMHPKIQGEFADLHNDWIQERLLRDEWMLDIREAVGEVEIRGYPSRLLRLNPQRHAVVSLESALDSDWLRATRRTVFEIAIGQLLKQKWEDVTLLANPLGRDYARELEAIGELKAMGVAR